MKKIAKQKFNNFQTKYDALHFPKFTKTKKRLVYFLILAILLCFSLTRL